MKPVLRNVVTLSDIQFIVPTAVMVKNNSLDMSSEMFISHFKINMLTQTKHVYEILVYNSCYQQSNFLSRTS